MKHFKLTDKTRQIHFDILSYEKLITELDADLKTLSDSISVSRDSYQETKATLDKMKELRNERGKYIKKVAELNRQLKETV